MGDGTEQAEAGYGHSSKRRKVVTNRHENKDTAWAMERREGAGCEGCRIRVRGALGERLGRHA